ncbi:MATE family efflux transporter [Bacteroidia bacterium]|nr:MATE family efflux transporter [Bacteroidia bacterium]
MSYRFGDYREYYRRNLVIAGPIILSHVGQMTVQLADNIMVGRLGALPLAAVSFGGAVFFILFIMGLGLSMGITPLVGEKHVQGHHRHNAIYLQNALVIYIVMGLLICALQYAMIPLLYRMGQPEEVVRLAVPFYKYMALSMAPLMVFAAFKQFLEGLGNTKVAMYVVVICNVVNVGLNYLFIYGHGGFPAMGAAGAGLASFISRCLMAVMIVVYFLHRDSLRRYLDLYRPAHIALRHMRTLLGVGVPISMQMVLEGGVFALSTVMVGWIGAEALAAHQIAMTIINIAFTMLIGVVSATTVMVSHEVGRGNREGIRRSANASYHMAIVYSLVMGMLFVALRNIIPLAFTADREVVAVASQLFVIAAGFEFCDAMQFASLGILRGLKDVRYTVAVAVVAYVLLNLPVGYALAFKVDLGVNGVWLGFAFGLSCAAFLLNRRYRRQMRKLNLK